MKTQKRHRNEQIERFLKQIGLKIQKDQKQYLILLVAIKPFIQMFNESIFF